MATLGAFDEVGKALCTRALRDAARDNLDGTIQMARLVSHHSHARASSLANGLAQLPVADVCLASSARSIGGGCRYGGVALGVTSFLGGNLGDAGMFRRAGIAATHHQRTVRFEGFIVG